MKITVTQFTGIAPRHSPRLLEPNQAQKAIGTRLMSGDLCAWSGLSKALNTQHANTKTIWLYQHQYWLQWSKDVEVVRGPVPGDTSNRIYFTGTDKPRFTNNDMALTGGTDYPVASYQLGIPAPSSGLTVKVTGSVTDKDPSLVEERAYTYTYVSKFGEEGPPAPASNIAEWKPGQSAKLSGFAVPSGEFVIDNLRIYRTNTTGASTIYEYVGDVSASTSTHTDKVPSDALGEQLPSEDWVAPPDDMHSLVALPNGILAGASGIDVCISEQYLPHAWPFSYRHTTDDKIVGLGVVNNSVVVLTEKRPYLVTGSSPDSMSMTAIASAEFACVSKRGIADMTGTGVMFPTANGLCAITQSGAANLTAKLMTKEQWQAYKPETMIGLVHRGKYFGFHDGGCIVFDPLASAIYELGETIRGGYVDPYEDVMYLIRGQKIMQWNKGDPEPYDWHSKLFELSKPSVFSAARVRAKTYHDVQLNIYADGTKVATIKPDNDQIFRLPVMNRSKRWSFGLTGTDRVETVEMAERLTEIA